MPARKSATTKQKKSESAMTSWFDLERSYLVFAIIYFPVAVLFVSQGAIEHVLLTLYTLVMFFIGLLLVLKFIIFFADAANEHRSNYGSLFAMYVFSVMIPLLMAKVYGYVFIRMMPRTHEGILCDLKNMALDMYYGVFNYQHTLDILIASSFAVFALMAVWAVGRKK